MFLRKALSRHLLRCSCSVAGCRPTNCAAKLPSVNICNALNKKQGDASKRQKKKRRNPCHGWYLSPLENHLCVPYDHLPPCLARRQMGYLAAAFLVCLEAEPSSSHHGVNAGTGRVLSPAMTPPWQLPINHFPRRAAPLSSQQHPRGRYKFYSFNPRYPALWHCVCRLKRMKRQMEVNSFGRQASIW